MIRRPPVSQVTFPAAPVFDNAPEAARAVAAESAAVAAVAAAGMGVVIHGADAATARPSGFAVVTWIGTVTPDNAIDGDIFENTA